MAKTRAFKNLNLRRKTNRSFCRNFLENHFRHLKLYSNPSSWLVRSHCHMGTFCKTKGYSSYFRLDQPFTFCYMGVHHQGRLKSPKNSNISPLLSSSSQSSQSIRANGNQNVSVDILVSDTSIARSLHLPGLEKKTTELKTFLFQFSKIEGLILSFWIRYQGIS